MMKFGFTDRVFVSHRSLFESLSSCMAGAVCAKTVQRVWEGPAGKRELPLLDAWDVVGLRTTASVWNVAKKYGPFAALFFFLKKEPTSCEKSCGS